MWRFSAPVVKAFGIGLAASIGLMMTQPPMSLAESGDMTGSMLLRNVVLEVSGYAEASELDNKVVTADGTLELITTTKPLLLHMEALRRAYGQFGQDAEQRKKLLANLKDRYMKEPDNAEKFFDYGYAQLVVDGNKNGLFFLRKANDKLASPATALAYGLAQVDVDLLVENATPDAMTTRKMDAMYKLKDALAYNRDDRLPGIWPSYVHILEGLKDYPAYESLVREDVTTIYVPYGSSSTSSAGSERSQLMMALETTSTDASATSSATSSTTESEVGSCRLSSTPANWSALAFSRSQDLNQDGTPESINFFAPAKSGDPYEVKVMTKDNQIITEFKSYKAPYLTEDIDGDGKFELVVRQFEKDPYHPLYVYRWNGSCYGQDKHITAYFK